ncbi:MAG: hypothetical protein WCX97_04800 [Candidatus Magasanikbacteria bacterium]
MQSTIQLFKRLYANLPPLFPADTADKMRHVLEHLEKDPTVTAVDVEKTMVVFGYEVWPWNEAFREFVSLAEGKVGEHFLLPRLSLRLQERFRDFKLYGGTWSDLHSGRPAEFFNNEDLSELCLALVDTQKDLRDYATREVMGLAREKYLERVTEFRMSLKKIRNKLDEMRQCADAEQDHPQLANEIRERVRVFEQGFCNLAPSCDYNGVCQSIEFFQGRKHDLNRLRGLHMPIEINFYNVGN